MSSPILARNSRKENEAYSGFPIDLLALVRCPRDAGTLFAKGSSATAVFEGEVTCASCGFTYHIREGVLRLLDGQRPLEGAVLDEQRARDTSVGRYENHFSDWENDEEFSAILANPDDFRSKTLLDLACGTGRFTWQLASVAAATIAADLSEESLRFFASKISPESKIGLIWGDATQLQFAPGSFDVVISTQLLEHIPSREKRILLFRAVHSLLRPSGILMITAYYYGPLAQILRRKQEGFHEGGIFYHRFSVPEVKAELGSGFRISEVRPLLPDRRVLAVLPDSMTRSQKGIWRRLLTLVVGRLLFIRVGKQTVETR